jgi:hypothetical protein
MTTPNHYFSEKAMIFLVGTITFFGKVNAFRVKANVFRVKANAF